MHLLRGAGLDGLKGMSYRSLPNAWSDEIPLVRPLLGVWREQIMAYLRQANLTPSLDASNLDTTFYRNRLRHELIPTLESYNPQARELIWRTADILGEDHRLLEALTQTAWDACALESGPGFVAFDINAFEAQPPGSQRRLVRLAIARLRPGLRDIDYAAVARALAFVAAPSASGQTDLIAGLRLLVEDQRLWLASWEADLPQVDWPQLPLGAELSLAVPGRLDLRGGWMLRSEPVPDVEKGRAQALDNDDPFQAWLDLDQLELPLTVRARLPGDRLSPLGMGGQSMKLAEFMVNRKLPRRAREHWPLVLAGDEIAWVPGMQIGHSFRLTPKVSKIARLWLIVK
jgi:tRNA(Ile)-lysidine synthase